MFFAIAVLFLHLPAVPQNLISRTGDATSNTTTPVVSSDTGAISKTSDRTYVVNLNPEHEDPVLEESSADSNPQPDPRVAYAPVPLLPGPLALATGKPATLVSLPTLPLPGTSAPFLFLTPTGTDSRLIHRRLWFALGMAQHGAATFDAWSTRAAISGGQCFEADPLMRPFAGNASIYAAIQVGPALLDYLGRRMMTSRHGWARRIWWLPQALGAAEFAASGVHNLGACNSH